MKKTRDRYVSFENIDCYNNAIEVIDAMKELFDLHKESKNDFWVSFEEKLPEDYNKEYTKDGSHDILYLVCANVYYISDLFEEYEFEKGIKLLEKAEMECC